MNIIIFLTLLLSTFRIGRLLAHEEGPFLIFVKLRHFLGVRYNPAPPYEAQGTNEISKGILCVWCNTVWVGTALTILYVIWQPFWLVVLPLALSGGAIIINESLDRN